jgi:hypothetical protein
MDVSSPGYMFGSWVLWSALILPTMYLNVNSDPKKTKVPTWQRALLLFLQVFLAGGAFAAAPSARALLMNPIPPIVMITMYYLLRYVKKDEEFDNKRLVPWVAISSLVAVIVVPQFITAVKRGNFVGGEFAGLQPGTTNYTIASTLLWFILLLPNIWFFVERQDMESTGKKPKTFAQTPEFFRLVIIAIQLMIVVTATTNPYTQGLIRNPIPPVIVFAVYFFSRYIKVTQEKRVRNTGITSLVLIMAFQVLQESLPSILSIKGATVTTGTSFYNNLSLLAWFVIILPSLYFFLRGRNEVVNENTVNQLPYNKTKKGFENLKDWQKDFIPVVQLLILYALAVGIQSFRGLFMNPVPPLAMMGLLAFTMWVQSNNADADYPDNEGLTAIIAAFGFGANFTLADPVLKMIFKNSGGAPPAEPEPVVFTPEPAMSPIAEPEVNVNKNKITNTNSNGRQ